MGVMVCFHINWKNTMTPTPNLSPHQVGLA